MKKVLICSQNGLGDLFFALFLAKNLHLHGKEVTLYYGSGSTLNTLTPYCEILAYPKEDAVELDLETYTAIYVFYNQDKPYIQKLMDQGKKSYKDKIFILYPYPTSYVKLKPYYDDSEINPEISFFENIQNFLRKKVEVTHPITTDLLPIDDGEKHNNTVVFHVTSSNPSKDWPIKKFMGLADRLKKRGYQVHFITKEKKYFEKEWKWLKDLGYQVPIFENLLEMKEFLSQASLVIGVDSGICHFASVLKVPTIVIGRREKILRFWQPMWAKSAYVIPSKWVPNLRLFRIRDKFWKNLVSISSVEKKALEFLTNT